MLLHNDFDMVLQFVFLSCGSLWNDMILIGECMRMSFKFN